MILDTCGLVWLAMGGGQLSSSALSAIASAPVVHVSAITAFEIGLKYAAGQLDLPCDPEKWYQDVLAHHRVDEVPVDGRIALAATKLPRIHKDPCDRMIIATAKLLGLRVVTADERFRDYGVEILS
jgi:PIN domain nuclease of toxin-antitoxin system